MSAENGIAPPSMLVSDIRLGSLSVGFGNVIVGESASQALVITNTGTAELVISNISLISGLFGVSDSFFNVAPGGSKAVTVSFSPTSLGAANGELRITSNDPDEGQVVVALNGIGISPSPTPVPDIALSVASLSFGNVTIGQSDNQALIITNTGSADLVVSNISSTSGLFTISDGSFTIASGGSKSITVSFTPVSAGPANGQLQITSNDPDEGQTSLGLSGTGVAPSPTPVPNIAVSESAISFGELTVNQSVNQTVTITNTGSADLNIQSITSTSDVFSFSEKAFTLSSGASRTVTVTFAPSATGSINGELRVSSNDPDQPILSFSLSGSGTAVQQQPPSPPQPTGPSLFVSDNTIDFGLVPKTETARRPLLLSNAGDATLIIQEIEANGLGFDVVGGTFSFVPGDNRSITVSFHPTVSGDVTGRLIIKSNDPSNPEAVVLLTGTGGRDPEIALDTTTLDFGIVNVGDTDTLEIQISNNGDDLLQVQNLAVSNAGFLIAEPAMDQVAGGESSGLKVIFAPVLSGSKSGVLTFSTTDPNQSSVTIELLGTAFMSGLVVDLRFDDSERPGKNWVEGENEANVNDGALTADSPFGSNAGTALAFQEGTVPGILPAGGNIDFAQDFTLEMFVKTQKREGVDQLVVGKTTGGGTVFELYLKNGKPHFLLKAGGQEALSLGGQVDDGFWHHVAAVRNTDIGKLSLFVDGRLMGEVPALNSNDIKVSEVRFGGFAVSLEELRIHNVALSEADIDRRDILIARNAQIRFNLSRIDMGFVLRGESRLVSLRLYNVGPELLIVDGIILPTAEYGVSGDNWEIPGGDSIDVEITFNPQRVGPITSDIRVSSNDPNGEVLLPVIGEVTVSPIVVRPDPLDFGNVAVGGQDSLHLNIQNISGESVSMTRVSSENAEFVIEEVDFQIEAGRDTSLAVYFHPAETGVRDGILVLASASFENNTLRFRATGNGINAPVIAVDFDHVDFDTVLIGESANQSLQIQNKGSDPLIIVRSQDVFIGDAQYRLISQFPFPLEIPAGRQVNFIIEFSPILEGAQETFLQIRSNDPTTESLTISLTGQGEKLTNSRAPTVRITVVSPGETVAWDSTTTIVLAGDAFDNDQNGQSIERYAWFSNLDDTLKVSTDSRDFRLEKQLSEWTIGKHTVTLRVWDNEGDFSDVSMDLEILGNRPVSHIDSVTVNGVATRSLIVRQGLDELVFYGSDYDQDEYGLNVELREWILQSESDNYANSEVIGNLQDLPLASSFLGIGRHKIIYRVTDNEGQVSDADTTLVTVRKRFGKAIIVAGGDLELLKRYSAAAANNVYQTLVSHRRFEPEDVVYLNPLAGWNRWWQDVRVTSRDVSVSRLKQEIENAKQDNVEAGVPLLIFLAGHGGVQTFQLASGEILEAKDLRAWLDQIALEKVAFRGLQSDREIPADEVVVVVDFCFSRTFLEIISGPGRIVIGSSSEERAAVIDGLSFAEAFFSRVAKGGDNASIWHSFEEARVQVGSVFSQAPFIDVNGDGIPVLDTAGNIIPGQEGAIAFVRQAFIGGEIGGRALNLGIDPEILSVSAEDLGNLKFGFNAAGLTGLTGLNLSFAIVPEKGDIPGPGEVGTGVFEEIQTEKPDSILYHSDYVFETDGTYTVLFIAQDDLGNYAGQRQLTLKVKKTESGDFDGNGSIGFGDFILFAQNFGKKQTDAGWNAEFDLDSNGEVGFGDFLMFSGKFGG